MEKRLLFTEDTIASFGVKFFQTLALIWFSLFSLSREQFVLVSFTDFLMYLINLLLFVYLDKYSSVFLNFLRASDLLSVESAFKVLKRLRDWRSRDYSRACKLQRWVSVNYRPSLMQFHSPLRVPQLRNSKYLSLTMAEIQNSNWPHGLSRCNTENCCK